MQPGDLGNGSGPADSANPVVVGVDGSHASIRAACWAAAVAVKLQAPLNVVHARPSLGHNVTDAIADTRAMEMELERKSAAAILKLARQAVESESGGLRFTTTEMDSPADQALVELSREARLIVLGSDDVVLGTAILIGSTTTTVATHSVCPVVAFRGEMTRPTKRPIVLGINHDDDSRVAAAAAFEFANRLGVGIIAVHTWSRRRPIGDISLPSMIDWNQLENDARQHLSRRLAPLIGLYPDIRVTEIIELDKPRRALLRHAKGAQLVVIGSRGRGLLAGALLGSTGLNLLHHSTIPVMICRSARE
jgi:nucleotide-binding universal stress UspA family protein